VVQTTSVTLYRDANPRWQNLYSVFTPYAVQLMIQDHLSCRTSPVNVVNVGDCFECGDVSGVVYRVTGHPITCQSPFFSQTSLPCCHIMSVFSENINMRVYDDANRWLKSNVVTALRTSQVAPPVDVHTLVGPEARHHRTETVLSRLSCLLKLCGSVQFVERIREVEKVVEAWESGKDCVVLASGDVLASESGDVVYGGSGDVVGPLLVAVVMMLLVALMVLLYLFKT